MPRKIPKPQLASAQKLSAFEMTKIHFGRSALQSSTTSGQNYKKGDVF